MNRMHHIDWHARAEFWKLRWWLLLCLMMGLSVAAQAQQERCWDTDGNLSLVFGAVSVGASVDTSGTASFTCQSNGAKTFVRACLYLSEGPGGWSDMSGVNPRKMTNYNGGSLAYTLYSDAARTQVLGPQNGAYGIYEKTVEIPSGWTNVRLDFPVYGRVGPVPLSASSGNYQAQFGGGVLVYAIGRNKEPASCTDGSYSTATKYFSTSAAVSNSCAVSVSATDLDFGTVSSLTASINSTSTITLTCPPNTNWKLGLGNGLNASGSQRQMAGPGGAYVKYDLYRDASRTLTWDAGSNVVTGSGGSPGSVTVYGRVPAQPEASPGNYKDTVTVTLTY